MFGRNKIKYFNPSREWGRESVGKTHKTKSIENETTLCISLMLCLLLLLIFGKFDWSFHLLVIRTCKYALITHKMAYVFRRLSFALDAKTFAECKPIMVE